MTPRHYQTDAVNSVFTYFEENRQGNPVIALPTGTGKSLVIALIIWRVLQIWPNQRFLVITHQKELIRQNFDEICSIWPDCPAGVYSAGLKQRDFEQAVIFCGIASIANKMEIFGHRDMVLVDECHLISPKDDTMYGVARESLRKLNPYIRFIGLTATPFRLGQGMITDGGLFTDICCDWTSLDRFNQLVDELFIAPLLSPRPDNEYDLSSVHISGGEYAKGELEDATLKGDVNYRVMEEMVSMARERKSWLVFCTGANHVRDSVTILNQLGIPALSYHSQGNMKDWEGKGEDNLKAFKRGDVQALVSVGMVTTGFNHKPVDFIGMARPTMSPSLWVQMLGRGTRFDYAQGFDLESYEGRKAAIAASGKQFCLVGDFAGNTRKLGPINDPMIPRKKGKRAGMVPYKVCPNVQCKNYCHARAAFCPACGTVFPTSNKLDLEASELALIKRRAEPVTPALQMAAPAEIAEYEVSHMAACLHQPRDPTKRPSLKITYTCGRFFSFNEWLALEHESAYARHKARDVWRLFEHYATGIPSDQIEPPETVAEALERIGDLRAPNKIRVLLSMPPKVVGHEHTDDIPDPSTRPIPDPADDEIPF